MIRELTVISGKGGCGKTTIAASFAALASNHVIADADVDAADMHILLQPETRTWESFSGLDIARKDEEKCIDCGKCYESCRYGAFEEDNTYHPEKCEGCAVCQMVCPVGAMKMVRRESGEAYISDTRFGPMAHAKLFAGEEASGKLVALVRQRARDIAEKEKRGTIIIDGPPGTGCTVIAAITGVDLVLVVIEPTLSGMHDSGRIVEVARHFEIPVVACINKFDVNPQNTKKIEEYCEAEEIPIIGRIAYDDTATDAMVAGKTVVEFSDGGFSSELKRMWRVLDDMLRAEG